MIVLLVPDDGTRDARHHRSLFIRFIESRNTPAAEPASAINVVSEQRQFKLGAITDCRYHQNEKYRGTRVSNGLGLIGQKGDMWILIRSFPTTVSYLCHCSCCWWHSLAIGKTEGVMRRVLKCPFDIAIIDTTAAAFLVATAEFEGRSSDKKLTLQCQSKESANRKLINRTAALHNDWTYYWQVQNRWQHISLNSQVLNLNWIEVVAV